MSIIIDGEKLAEEILLELKKEREKLDKIRLAVFLIGKEEEKIRFLKVKERFAKELDIDFRVYEVDENISRKKLRKYIHQIIKSDLVNGAIIQLPLPDKFKTQYFLNSIPPIKDVDCLSSKNLGNYFTDNYIIRPSAVEVVDFIKNKFKLSFENKVVLVVGYGRLIGKPLVHYFAREKSTVIVTNSKSNIDEFLEKVDVIVSGAGKANLINECKENAILIDFGYSFENGKIFGDINFEKLKNKSFLITPTPNGTGPILVAMVFKNLIKLAKVQRKII